jgi:hypothetical protein
MTKGPYFYVYLCSCICDAAQCSGDLPTSILIYSVESDIIFCDNHPSHLSLNRFSTKINPHCT